MALQIKTNNQERELLSFYEFSLAQQQQLRSDFDWIDEEELASPGFFTYRGTVHHISQFLPFGTLQIQYPELCAWHAYESDTYFSGTVIRASEDGETVVVGTYFNK